MNKNEIARLVDANKKYFNNDLSEFIYYRTYSRWMKDEGRREVWTETVERYMEFMKEKLGDKLTIQELQEIHNAILNMEVMPSMRLMWSAGDAVNATNVCAYNCSYIAPTKWQDFGEILYILMCGTGVGFSVEQQFVKQLPKIQNRSTTTKKYQVKDSKEGWADSLVALLEGLENGIQYEFDYSQLRPKGARLDTMGGRSSGPEPLKNLHSFIYNLVYSNTNLKPMDESSKFRPIHIHDIICKIGECVVSGGVRRSALISLSDLDDKEMRDAKKGKWYKENPQRALANNSAVYNGKPKNSTILKEWASLIESRSGERGIFNRGSLHLNMPPVRWNLNKYTQHANEFGTNPCGEIILRNKQFCNLTEVVCRPDDTMQDMLRKIRIATILGTFQSTLINFKYLSDDWKKNCEEERLLGVSLTGIHDWIGISATDMLKDDFQQLRNHARNVNVEYAERFNINISMSISCVKPSGNVSQLVNSSSGMHPRYSDFYIRRVRINATDPLLKLMKKSGVKCIPEVNQDKKNPITYVIEFPIKSVNQYESTIHHDALDQFDLWYKLKANYTDHNPSVTLNVEDYEWIELLSLIMTDWDKVGGLAFLPKTNHIYELAPYEAISEDEYNKRVKQMPKIDYSQLLLNETEDTTEGNKELSCVGNICEI